MWTGLQGPIAHLWLSAAAPSLPPAGCTPPMRPAAHSTADTRLQHDATKAILVVLLGPLPPRLIIVELKFLLLHALVMLVASSTNRYYLQQVVQELPHVLRCQVSSVRGRLRELLDEVEPARSKRTGTMLC
jgi:hypothetical protein